MITPAQSNCSVVGTTAATQLASVAAAFSNSLRKKLGPVEMLKEKKKMSAVLVTICSHQSNHLAKENRKSSSHVAHHPNGAAPKLPSRLGLKHIDPTDDSSNMKSSVSELVLGGHGIVFGTRIPKHYFLVKGFGETDQGDGSDPWETGSYDLALEDAGMCDCSEFSQTPMGLFSSVLWSSHETPFHEVLMFVSITKKKVMMMMRGRFGWSRNSRPEHNPVLISDPTRGGNCDIGRGQTFLEARGSHGIYHGQNARCEGRSYNCRSGPDAGHFTFFLVMSFLLPFLFFLSFFYFLRDFWQSFWYFLFCFWFLWERCLTLFERFILLLLLLGRSLTIFERLLLSSAPSPPSWEISDVIWEISSSAPAPWEISDNLGKTFPSSPAYWEREISSCW